MTSKRLRVFAGPNGSGKTSIIQSLSNKIPFGCYINADDIERALKLDGYYQHSSIVYTHEEFINFLCQESIAAVKCSEVDYKKHIRITDNRFIVEPNDFVNSYIAADIAAYLRQCCLQLGLSLTFETVFSHPSKLDFLKQAKALGYRIYHYFITTETPEINISRVKIRVAQSGHYVKEEVVENRFAKTMQMLPQIIRETDRAYLFDNSGSQSIFVAEITKGIDVEIQCQSNNIPNWFLKCFSME